MATPESVNDLERCGGAFTATESAPGPQRDPVRRIAGVAFGDHISGTHPRGGGLVIELEFRLGEFSTPQIREPHERALDRLLVHALHAGAQLHGWDSPHGDLPSGSLDVQFEGDALAIRTREGLLDVMGTLSNQVTAQLGLLGRGRHDSHEAGPHGNALDTAGIDVRHEERTVRIAYEHHAAPAHDDFVTDIGSCGQRENEEECVHGDLGVGRFQR